MSLFVKIIFLLAKPDSKSPSPTTRVVGIEGQTSDHGVALHL